MSEAHALASEADLLLAIGSSLEVYPVASLPGVTLRRGRAPGARHPGADALRPPRRR